jgi:hypothetical protein
MKDFKIGSLEQRLLKKMVSSWIPCHKSLLILLIPLFLSSFIHLFNPIGFPWIHEDEGHYMRRAMHVLQGLGAQETTLDFDHPYDHPYFGQLFLASILNVIGYPHTLNLSSSDSRESVGIFYLAPRILMGLLAIVDTFLVYKIAERKYNINVALIASILFAVMPLTWLLRGIFLDNILLPFLLLSILCGLYGKDIIKEQLYSNKGRHLQHSNRKMILVMLSGIFMGLAIFTKIPACMMIPLVALIIYRHNNKNTRHLEIWFIPVVTIASIWPLYNIWSGQFDDWLEGVVWQTIERPEKPLLNSLIAMMNIDPVLIILGIAGLVYAALLETSNRNYFITLWIIPYLIFLYFIGWVSYFHWIILVPGLAISAAILIEGLLGKMIVRGRKRIGLISYNTTIIVSVIGIFGLLSCTMLVRIDATSSYFELYSFIVQQLTENDQDKESFDGKPGTTIIGHRWTWAFTWIPRYIFHDRISFVHFNSSERPETERFLLIVDNYVKRHLSDKNSESIKMVQALYNDSHAIKTFEDKTIIPYSKDIYPFTSMSENRGIGRYSPVEIRTNTK